MEDEGGEKGGGDHNQPLVDQIVDQHEPGITTAGDDAGETGHLVGGTHDGYGENADKLPGQDFRFRGDGIEADDKISDQVSNGSQLEEA